jgi:hypothetical protein
MARNTTIDETDGADDLAAVADRLEAALERIVRRLDNPEPDPPSAQIAARLDGLIGRLRDALASSPA